MVATIIVSGAAGFVKRALIASLQSRRSRRPAIHVIDSMTLPYRTRPIARPVHQVYHIGSDRTGLADAMSLTRKQTKILMVDLESDLESSKQICIPDVYGPGMDTDNNIISSFCSDVSARRPIVLPANANAYIAPTYIADAVQYIEMSMNGVKYNNRHNDHLITIADLAARISRVANVRHRTIIGDKIYKTSCIQSIHAPTNINIDTELRRTLVDFYDRQSPESHRHLFDRLIVMAGSNSAYSAWARALVEQQEGWLDPQIPPEILRAIYD